MKLTIRPVAWTRVQTTIPVVLAVALGGCALRSAAYQVVLVPQATPVTVHVVPASAWDKAPCGIGTLASACVPLRGTKTYVLSAANAVPAKIGNGNKVLAQVCSDRVARVSRVELSTVSASGDIFVGC